MKTIIGTWHDAQGTTAAWGKQHLVLNLDASVIETNQVAPRNVVFQLLEDGSLPDGSLIWANDELSPNGTYYTATVTERGGGVIWGPQWIVVAGPEPVDLASFTPLKVIPVVNQFSSLANIFGAGVISTPLSADTGSHPSAFVTVSNQFLLAPGNNISFSGSQSQHSLSVTIHGMSGGGPSFTMGALGQTATNQASMIAGSNITLRTSTAAAGLSIYVDAQSTHPTFTAGVGGTNTAGTGSTVTNHLVLAGGSNITLSRTTNAGGMTVSILGQAQSAQPAFSAGLTQPNALGQLGPATDRLYLAGGNNITLEGFTSPNGMTVSIEGQPMGEVGPGGQIFQAGLGNALGQLGPVENALYMYGGNSITLSGSVNGGSLSVTVSGPITSQSLQTFPASSAQSFAFNSSGGSINNTLGAITIPNLRFEAGSNVSFNVSTNALGQNITFRIDAAGGAALSVESFRAQLNATTVGGGSTSGVTHSVTNLLRLAAGSNVFLSGATTGGASNSILDLTIQARQASLVTGNANITINTAANNSGTTWSIFGPSPGGGPGGALSLIEGPNITIDQITGAGGTTATIAGESAGAPGPGASFRAQLWSLTQGGSTSGNSQSATNYLRFAAGSNIFLSGVTGGAANNTSVLYLSINARQASLVEGNTNVSISTTANNSGTTYSIFGPSPSGGPGGAAGISWVHLGAIGGSVSGETDMTDLHMMDFHAGSNVTLVGSTGTHPAGNYGVIDIHAGGGGPGGGVFSAGLGTHVTTNTQWSNTSLGQAGPVTGRLNLVAGPYITLSGATNANGSMTVTVQGQKQILFEYSSIAGGALAGHTSSTAWIAPGRMRLIAGSNVSFSVNTDTAWYQTLTMNVRALTLHAGEHIGLVTATNSAGTNVTITGAGGSVGGAAFTAGVENSMGNTFSNSHGLMVFAGRNVSLGTHAHSMGGQAVLGLDIDGPPVAYVYGTNNITVNSAAFAGWNNFTISGPNTYSYGAGIGSGAQPGGQTLGTGLTNNAGASGGMRFYAGSNITLSGSISPTQFMSISIFGASGGGGTRGDEIYSFGAAIPTGAHPGGGTGGTGTSSGAGQIGLSGGIRFYAGSNITLSGGTSSNGILYMSIFGASGGAAAPVDDRYFARAEPLMPYYTTWGHMGTAPGATGATFWPFQPGIHNAHARSVNFYMKYDFSNYASQTGTMDFTLGIYTRNGQTLSRMSSGTAQYRWSLSSANRERYEGVKMIKIAITNMSFDYRDYWFGLSMTSNTSGNNYSYSGIFAEVMSGDMNGELGAVTNSSWQRVLGWGQYRSAGALPASIVFSQLAGTAATALRAPLMYLAGTSY